MDLTTVLAGLAAFSAGASALAAFLSLGATKDALSFQKSLALFERTKFLYELLKADASRANDSLGNKKITEVGYAQIADITLAFESAQYHIIKSEEYLSKEERKTAKYYFKSQLKEEIVQAMYDNTPPEVIWSIEDSSYEEQMTLNRWYENRDFFGFKIDMDTVFDD